MLPPIPNEETNTTSIQYDYPRAHPVFVIVYEVVDADLIIQAQTDLRTRGRASFG